MEEKKKTSDYGVEDMKREIIRRIKNNSTPYVIKDGDHYEVWARNLHFKCIYSDEEIEKMASLCLELLEELRQINEAGFTRENLTRAEEDVDEKGLNFMRSISIYKSFSNDKTDGTVDRLGETARVGGAYFMFLSRPTFISAIYAVFDVIIDKFDDAELYFSSLFMLTRMAMHMHCDEVNEEEQSE